MPNIDRNNKKFLIKLINQVFVNYYKKFNNEKLFFELDNYQLTNDLLSNEYVHDAIDKAAQIDYVKTVKKLKAFHRGYRNVQSISLQNNICLSYLVLQYCIEIKAFTLSEENIPYTANPLELIQFSDKVYSSNMLDDKIFIVRDIKDFYPSLSISVFRDYFPRDNHNKLNDIIDFYEKIHEKAAEDFGLLQGPWHSRLLADVFLSKMDNAITEKGISFFRKNDAFYFPKSKTSSFHLADVDEIFKIYRMQYNEYYYKQKTTRLINNSLFKAYNSFASLAYPLKSFERKLIKNRTALTRILRQIPKKIKKQKLAFSLLQNPIWDNYEIYHILDWVIINKIDVSQRYSLLIEIYANAKWFLRAQIRQILLINKEEEMLEKIFDKFSHEEMELIQFNTLKNLIR